MRRLSMPLAAAGATGVGAAIGLIGARGQGTAHLDEGHDQGRYTHGSSNCAVESRKDPINIVFVGLGASWSQVEGHVSLPSHGGWDDQSGGQQYFIDHYGYCQPMDGQSASAGGLSTRYHMRYNQGDISGQPDFDSSLGGYYTLASAHHEVGGLVCDNPIPGLPNLPGHRVESNLFDPPGGFEMGRQELLDRWLRAGDGHEIVDVKDWENWEWMLQCDNHYAWSSGLVDYISMPGGGDWGWGTGNVYRAMF